MTVDDIEAGFPWGFHDADLRGFGVDLAARTATFDLDVPVDERQTKMRSGQLTVAGVQFVTVSPPMNDSNSEALWIDSFEGRWTADNTTLPPLAEGVFLHTFFRKEAGSVIYIAAREAAFHWTGDEFAAGSERPTLYFPGEDLP